MPADGKWELTLRLEGYMYIGFHVKDRLLVSECNGT